MTDGPDTPHTPARDEPDNEDFGATEEVAGGGYPEEGPGGTDSEDESPEGSPEHPQRDKG